MMEVTLHEATDQDLPIAKKLVPYYIYDMSEHLGWPCTADGRFYGSVTIKLTAAKVAHVETETRRMWEYRVSQKTRWSPW